MRFNPTFASTVTADIQGSEQSLQAALQQVSTGRRVNLPSDDPGASAALVQSLNQSANVDQYTSNADTALSQAQTADATLSSVVGLLNKAITLGTEGANGTTAASERQTIATEIQGLLSSVVSEANTNFEGVPLFGGTATGSTPFQQDAANPGSYLYTGNSGVNSVQVSDTQTVQTNIAGDTLFLQPGSSAIGSLEQLAAALASGSSADIGTATSAVTAALNYVTQQHAVYGNAVNRLTAQESYLAQEKVTLTSQQSSLVGIDPATAAEGLAQAETQNSAVLAAAARVLPNTLLDYLK